MHRRAARGPARQRLTKGWMPSARLSPRSPATLLPLGGLGQRPLLAARQALQPLLPDLVQNAIDLGLQVLVFARGREPAAGDPLGPPPVQPPATAARRGLGVDLLIGIGVALLPE